MHIDKLYNKALRKLKRKSHHWFQRKKYFYAEKSLLQSYEDQYQDQVKREPNIVVSGTATQCLPKAQRSHARDYAFEQILKSGAYTFEYPYVAVDPYNYAPLSALLLFCTEEQSRVRFVIIENDMTISETTALSKEHRVFLYGFIPDKINKVRLELLDTSGNILNTNILEIYMDQLPDSLTDMLKEKNFQNQSAYPLIFITGGSLYPIAFDQTGDIRYLLKLKTSSYGIFPLKNGRLLWGEENVGVPTFANAHTCQIHEMDYTGRIHRTLLIEKGIHHFATELPNGNIVAISNTMDGCTEDMIIEIDRSTGKILQEIDMRIFFGSEYRDMVDWVHPNSLSYDETDDTMLICLRNVHSVLKFRWATKEILWLLSIPEFWQEHPLQDKVLRPVGKIRWNYQAHAAYEMPRREGQDPDIRCIMVFDNHRVNRRPCAQFNKSNFSYINIYAVNEKEHTVEMEKQFEIPKSLIRSNAVYDLPTNRVFAMEGCLEKDKDLPYRGKILEMDYETGDIINSVALKKDFFSAHPFDIGYSSLLSAADYNKLYMVNELVGPTALNEVPEISKELQDPIIDDMVISDEFLYFKAKDHDVQKFFFVGEKKAYVKDYTNTWQTNHFHEDRHYYCVIAMENLLPGMYKVAIQYEGELYQSNHTVNVMKDKRRQEVI